MSDLLKAFLEEVNNIQEGDLATREQSREGMITGFKERSGEFSKYKDAPIEDLKDYLYNRAWNDPDNYELKDRHLNIYPNRHYIERLVNNGIYPNLVYKEPDLKTNTKYIRPHEVKDNMIVVRDMKLKKNEKYKIPHWEFSGESTEDFDSFKKILQEPWNVRKVRELTPKHLMINGVYDEELGKQAWKEELSETVELFADVMSDIISKYNLYDCDYDEIKEIFNEVRRDKFGIHKMPYKNAVHYVLGEKYNVNESILDEAGDLKTYISFDARPQYVRDVLEKLGINEPDKNLDFTAWPIIVAEQYKEVIKVDANGKEHVVKLGPDGRIIRNVTEKPALYLLICGVEHGPIEDMENVYIKDYTHIIADRRNGLDNSDGKREVVRGKAVNIDYVKKLKEDYLIRLGKALDKVVDFDNNFVGYVNLNNEIIKSPNDVVIEESNIGYINERGIPVNPEGRTIGKVIQHEYADSLINDVYMFDYIDAMHQSSSTERMLNNARRAKYCTLKPLPKEALLAVLYILDNSTKKSEWKEKRLLEFPSLVELYKEDPKSPLIGKALREYDKDSNCAFRRLKTCDSGWGIYYPTRDEMEYGMTRVRPQFWKKLVDM